MFAFLIQAEMPDSGTSNLLKHLRSGERLEQILSDCLREGGRGWSYFCDGPLGSSGYKSRNSNPRRI